ncbi:tetratricopeptide repeat protein, partial [Paramuribaculum intestinale]
MMRLLLWIMAIAVLLAAGGCSTRKNTAANRQYQSFITRYNILFNGDEHYRQTLADMERSYDDDFTRLLPVHPAEARRDPKAPQPQGDFGRSIEKAQKAIRVRSIKKKPRRQAGRRSDPEYRKWMQREEYNPYLHNAWMLLGRSRYMNGEFLPAATTFMYVANHFQWLPQTVAEARIWQARSYLAEGWTGEAEATLGRVRESDLTSDELRHQYALAQAEAAIARRDWQSAAAPLRQAAAT